MASYKNFKKLTRKKIIKNYISVLFCFLFFNSDGWKKNFKHLSLRTTFIIQVKISFFSSTDLNKYFRSS